MKWLLLCCAAILQSQRPTWSTLPSSHSSFPQQNDSPTACWTFNFCLIRSFKLTVWLNGRPKDEETTFLWQGFSLKAPRVIFLCGLKKSLQPKVNGANSICHGLHGGKIKNFFLFKAQGFFLLCISKKERRQLSFVALCRVYFGFHWNGTKLLEMPPIKKSASFDLHKIKDLNKPDLNTSSTNPPSSNSGEVCVSLD